MKDARGWKRPRTVRRGVDGDGTGCPLLEARGDAQERRFAAAARPNDGDEFAVRDFEVDAVDRNGSRREDLAQAVNDDSGIVQRRRVPAPTGRLPPPEELTATL